MDPAAPAASPEIAYCKIYPGIGVARVGNSPEEYFIGPEAPGHPPAPTGGFRDAAGRIKRQAARFRVYAFDAKDQVIMEITAATPGMRVEWTVQLANKKASWYIFDGVAKGMQTDQAGAASLLRNRKEKDRSKLEITPPAKSISGTDQHGVAHHFTEGEFYGISVPLGELRTDEHGRLLVLGGYGFTSKTDKGKPITHYANNDFWHDDTSDGPVTAKVSRSGKEIPVKGASWVLVAPPKFAPNHLNAVTLYDVMREAAQLPIPSNLSFREDLYPFFARIADYQWLNAMALRGHGPRRGGNFRDPDIAARLADNSAGNQVFRQSVFSRLRNPRTQSKDEANYSFMPALSGDEGDVTVGDPSTWLYLIESQYAMLEQWAQGNFRNDWTGEVLPLPAFDSIEVLDQPAALDRASLEFCVGGAFFPGIEITYIARYRDWYAEPFRFQAARFQPGDMTKRMACPWQADFFECQVHWWPAQRPDDVLNEATYTAGLQEFPQAARDGTLAVALPDRIRWDRGVGDRLRLPPNPPGTRQPRVGDNDMVGKWSTLGFVEPRTTPGGETLYVETGRSQYDGLTDREYLYILLNLDSYPDFLPKAQALAEEFLQGAEDLLNSPDPLALDDMYHAFDYSAEALAQRLDDIYAFYQQAAEQDPTADPDNIFRSREDLVERVRQFAPLNQLDGAWLRNIAHAGPVDSINAFLFSIWMDEVGDGVPEQNHCNVYVDLMESVGIKFPPLTSHAYIENEDLLDSAFTVPMYELAISQFTQTYFPEILGMTLQLEWEVLALKPTIKLFKHFGINPHFYELHVGIDNAADGHGAKARRAVVAYLDQARARGGEAEVERLWRRIWRGYVAFATTGTMGQDLRELLAERQANPATPADKVAALIQEKKPYGSRNHGEKQIGPSHINDLFEDPPVFMQSLIDGGFIVPGSLEQSRFFKLTSFEGPMYKVFNDAELKIWENWVVWLGTTSGGGTGQPVETDPAKLMAACIDQLRGQQRGTAGHDRHQLTGPDPVHPGSQITQPVAKWFDSPTPVFMAVLSNPANGWIVPGNAVQSRFVTELLGGANAMSDAFSAVVPNSGGRTCRAVATDWINKGCPLPSAVVPPSVEGAPVVANDARIRAMVSPKPAAHPRENRTRLTLTSSVREVRSHPRQRVLGMGCVH